MKIAIINLTGGGMSGGYRKYLRNVIPRMAKHPEVDAILCASPTSVNVKDWFEPLSNVKFVSCRPYRFLVSTIDAELNQQLKKFSPDVLFVPVERYFRFDKVPVVNMIQNMEPLSLPLNNNPFDEKIKNLIRRVVAKQAISKSQRVIAVSNFVRKFLLERWHIPNEKIGLVYYGIDVAKHERGCPPICIPKDWKGKFLFTAGSIRPARGLEDIFWALKYLSDNAIDVCGLVIAGETTPNTIRYQEQLKNWLQKHNLSSKICWAGSLNEKEMAWCYQNCQIFVMTSRVEACPNIALEAMAHGCVCVSTESSPMPEFFRDAAVYYPPKDGKALAEAIKTAISWDDNQQKVMSEKARNRATEFLWDVCVEKTVAEFKKAIETFRCSNT